MNRTTIAFGALMMVVAGVWFLWPKNSAEAPVIPEEQVMCTMDAKLCPDGSYVGRTGPKCEFALCPGEVSGEPYPWQLCDEGERCPTVTPFTGLINTWEEGIDDSKKIVFRYPERLNTEYVSVVEWPPVLTFSKNPYSCNAGGTEVEPAGKTEERKIIQQKTCVTTKNEGAAGSTYLTYVYTRPFGEESVSISFGLREPQCANYSAPEKAECEKEQEEFSIDMLFETMMGTVEYNQ